MNHTRFRIAPAGWFSVFVPSGRPSRLTAHSRHPYLKPYQDLADKSFSPRFALLQTPESEMRSRHLLRAAGITLSAAITTWLLLCWLCSYGT